MQKLRSGSISDKSDSRKKIVPDVQRKSTEMLIPYVERPEGPSIRDFSESRGGDMPSRIQIPTQHAILGKSSNVQPLNEGSSLTGHDTEPSPGL